MKKIIFLLAMGLAFIACDDQTKIELESQTSLIGIDLFSEGELDDTGREYLYRWTDMNIEEVVVEVTVRVYGWASAQPRKFRLYQSNAPTQPGQLLFAYPDITYAEFAGTEFEIPAGTSEVKVPITLIKDESRLNHAWVNNDTNRGYVLQVAISSDDLDSNLITLPATDSYANIRVWNRAL